MYFLSRENGLSREARDAIERPQAKVRRSKNFEVLQQAETIGFHFTFHTTDISSSVSYLFMYDSFSDSVLFNILLPDSISFSHDNRLFVTCDVDASKF